MSGGGHIRQRSAGSWELRYPLPTDRRHPHRDARGSKKAAQAKLRELMAAVDHGEHVAGWD